MRYLQVSMNSSLCTTQKSVNHPLSSIAPRQWRLCLVLTCLHAGDADHSSMHTGWYTDADVKQMRGQQDPAMCSCSRPRSFCRHPSCLALYCQACERKITEKGYDESFQWCKSCYPRPCKAAPGHFCTEHVEEHLDRCQNVAGLMLQVSRPAT